MDVAILVDHRVNIKDSEKINKYLDLQWAEKVVEHENDGEPVVVGANGMVLKDLEKRMGELDVRNDQVHRSVEIIFITWRVLET